MRSGRFKHGFQHEHEFKHEFNPNRRRNKKKRASPLKHDRYLIEGNFPIRGKIKAGGNKNAALACIPTTLLTDDPVTLRNIPEIEDVKVMLRILENLGSSVTKNPEPNSYTVQTRDIKTSEISSEEARKVRASLLFAGPLLARIGEVKIPPPGGDVIGRRRLDTHTLALEKLGTRIVLDGIFHMTSNKLVGQDIFLDEASVTGTENAVMAAVTAEGKTRIGNAASEPHVQDLCRLLVMMGALIKGIGTNVLEIEGVRKLGGADFTIGADYMEVGSLIGLAAATRGELEITHAAPQNMRMCQIAFNKLGIHWQAEKETIYVPAHQPLQINKDLGGHIPHIDDAPWPGFPADLISIIVVVATQTKGTVLVHEKMFDGRLFFVDRLISMGAGIILCDPHRVVVSGPSPLSGSNMASPDVRAGMALLIAAMCASGKSCIQNIYQIERGYEDLAGRLSQIGGRIKKIP